MCGVDLVNPPPHTAEHLRAAEAVKQLQRRGARDEWHAFCLALKGTTNPLLHRMPVLLAFPAALRSGELTSDWCKTPTSERHALARQWVDRYVGHGEGFGPASPSDSPRPAAASHSPPQEPPRDPLPKQRPPARSDAQAMPPPAPVPQRDRGEKREWTPSYRAWEQGAASGANPERGRSGGPPPKRQAADSPSATSRGKGSSGGRGRPGSRGPDPRPKGADKGKGKAAPRPSPPQSVADRAWDAWQNELNTHRTWRPKVPWTAAPPADASRVRGRASDAAADQPPPQRPRRESAGPAATASARHQTGLSPDSQRRKTELCARVRNLKGHARQAWMDWAKECRAESGVGWKGDPELNSLATLESYFEGRRAGDGAVVRSRSRADGTR